MVMSGAARFSIEDVFDLPARPGLLATGKVQSGVFTAGMTRIVRPPWMLYIGVRYMLRS
jgi:hypothetical protein